MDNTMAKGLKLKLSDLTLLIQESKKPLLRAALDCRRKEFVWCPTPEDKLYMGDEVEPVDWEHSIPVPSLSDANLDGITLRRTFASKQREEVSNALYAALETSHHWRRKFEEVAVHYNVYDEWVQYENDVLEDLAHKIAIDWCEENGIVCLPEDTEIKNEPDFIRPLI